jgi:hypothetical protein
MSDILGDPRAPRKLAAILAADIAGYSALMGLTMQPPFVISKGTKA